MTDTSPDITEAKPEADVLEQRRPVVDDEEPELPVSIPPDVPEADALEQAIPVPLADEDERL